MKDILKEKPSMDVALLSIYCSQFRLYISWEQMAAKAWAHVALSIQLGRAKNLYTEFETKRV
jgi:hypothetical protein